MVYSQYVRFGRRLVLVVVALALVAAACSDDESGGADPATSSASSTTTTTVAAPVSVHVDALAGGLAGYDIESVAWNGYWYSR